MTQRSGRLGVRYNSPILPCIPPVTSVWVDEDKLLDGGDILIVDLVDAGCVGVLVRIGRVYPVYIRTIEEFGHAEMLRQVGVDLVAGQDAEGVDAVDASPTSTG